MGRKKYMKITSACIGIFCLFLLSALPARAALIDGIAAIVNNDVITEHELMGPLELYQQTLPKNMEASEKEKILKEAKQVFLNRLIDNALVMQEAKRLGIGVKDEEVQSSVQDFIKKQNMTLEQFKSGLKKEGGSYEQYCKEAGEHLIRMRLAAREIKSKITVSDDEIGEYYGKHRGIYEGREAVKLRQILFPLPPKGDGKIVHVQKKKAEAIAKKLKSGESFSTVMQEGIALGADPNALADLGFIEKGTMLREVEDVAFRLQIGEFSPVISSQAGFHIIQVVDKRGAGIKPLSAVREEIIEEISKVKIEKKFQDWIQEVRKGSYIEIKTN
jgi:parvulin-like peptidyl-prolyl isomerase